MVTYVYHGQEHLSTSEGPLSESGRLTRTRVRGVSQPVTDEGERHHRDGDGEGGEQHQVRRRADGAVAVRDKPAPTGRGRWKTQPDEGERRLREYGERDAEDGRDYDRPQGVRQEVGHHNPKARGPHRPSGQHEVALLQG